MKEQAKSAHQSTGAQGGGVNDGGAEILYAGDAPGLVEGVVQINFRLPELAGDGLTPLQVQIANYGDSGLPQIWIR